MINKHDADGLVNMLANAEFYYLTILRNSFDVISVSNGYTLSGTVAPKPILQYTPFRLPKKQFIQLLQHKNKQSICTRQGGHPNYLGVKLVRQLTCKQHVKGLCQKILARKIVWAALLARHGVPMHPPFVQQPLQSSLARQNMLTQFGVVALTTKS